MNWSDITTDLDTYFADIPDPTDDDLRQIEEEWFEMLDDDAFEIPEGILELLWQETMKDE